MKNKEHWMGRVKKLFTEQRLCVLATQDEMGPYTSLVGFVASEDIHCLYFATTKQTAKFKNLSEHSRVSVLVDDRKNQEADFGDSIAVTALGLAKPVKTEDCEQHKSRYLRKHPYLQSFIEAPSCQLVEVEIEKYFVVSRFQSVVELRMKK